MVPFFCVPVSVYNWKPSGSWMQATCFFSVTPRWKPSVHCQRVAPPVSLPCSPLKAAIRSDSKRVISSVPCVRRRQWRTSSPLVSCMSCMSDWPQVFLKASSDRLASLSLCRSSLLHSKIHWDSLFINRPYSGWLSVVQPDENRRMKCQMSKRTCVLGHPEVILRMLLEPQQSRSTYIISGGLTPAPE